MQIRATRFAGSDGGSRCSNCFVLHPGATLVHSAFPLQAHRSSGMPGSPTIASGCAPGPRPLTPRGGPSRQQVCPPGIAKGPKRGVPAVAPRMSLSAAQGIVLTPDSACKGTPARDDDGGVSPGEAPTVLRAPRPAALVPKLQLPGASPAEASPSAVSEGGGGGGSSSSRRALLVPKLALGSLTGGLGTPKAVSSALTPEAGGVALPGAGDEVVGATADGSAVSSRDRGYDRPWRQGMGPVADKGTGATC